MLFFGVNFLISNLHAKLEITIFDHYPGIPRASYRAENHQPAPLVDYQKSQF